MSYQVIARKWRPKKFEDVIGQQHVSVTLQNAITSDHLAHAYIFAGPRGVGKTTTARILAKALNCEKSQDGTPCDECSSCNEIAAGRNLDVIEIDAASNTGVDNIRDLRENARYTPVRGKYKIFIIDEAHMLSRSAFNALLKTLEEPPAHVLFIFATTEPHKLPATIISRCQRFDFKRLSLNLIVKHLENICRSEKIQAEEEALILIAKKADGGMRDAQSLLDQMISFCGNQISAEAILSALGIVNQDLFFEVSELIRNRDMKKCLELASRVSGEGIDFKEFINGLAEHMRNLLVVKTTGLTELVDASESIRQRYVQESGFFEEDDLLRYLKLLSSADYFIKESSSPRTRFELTLIQLVKMDSSVQINQLLEELQSLKKNSNSPSADIRPPEPQSRFESVGKGNFPGREGFSSPALKSGLNDINKNTFRPAVRTFSPPLPPLGIKNPSNDVPLAENTGETTFLKIKENWEKIVSLVKNKKVSLGVLVSHCEPVGLEGKILKMVYNDPSKNGSGEFNLGRIEKEKSFIETCLRETTRLDLKIQCSLSRETKEESAEKPVPEDDPLLKKIIETFDAEIIQIQKGKV